jgi:hypothetical protein
MYLTIIVSILSLIIFVLAEDKRVLTSDKTHCLTWSTGITGTQYPKFTTNMGDCDSFIITNNANGYQFKSNHFEKCMFHNSVSKYVVYSTCDISESYFRAEISNDKSFALYTYSGLAAKDIPVCTDIEAYLYAGLDNKVSMITVVKGSVDDPATCC